MQTLDTRQADGHLIDYTAVPAGLLIKGDLTTGQAVFPPSLVRSVGASVWQLRKRTAGKSLCTPLAP